MRSDFKPDRDKIKIQSNQTGTSNIGDNKLRIILNAGESNLFALIDAQCRLIEMNEAFARLYRIKPEEGYDMNLCTILAENGSFLLSEKIKLVFDKNEKTGFIHFRANRWFDSSIVPIKTGDGSIEYIVINSHDITELKVAENELKSNQSRYKTLIESIPAKIFLKDVFFNYVSCNSEFASGFNLTEEEIISKSDYDLHPEEIAEKIRLEDLRIIETGEETDIEESYISNGKECWVQILKKPVLDTEGRISGILGLYYDITTRKNIEKEIREKEERLRLITDSINDIIWIMDEHGKLKYMSKAVERVLGFSVESYIDRPIKHLMSDEVKPFLSEALSLSRKGLFGAEARKKEFQVNAKSGKMVDIEISVNPIFDTDGSFMFLLGVSRDISQRKKNEQKILESEEKFRALSENSLDAIFRVNTAGEILYANKAAMNLFGLAEEYREIMFPELILEEGKSRQITEQIELVIKYKDSVEYELFLSHYNIWLNIFLIPEFNELGNVAGVLVSARNISQRKRIEEEIKDLNEELEARVEQRTEELKLTLSQLRIREEELVQSERRFRGAVEYASYGITLLGIDGSFEMVNNAFCRIMGYEEVEMLKLRFEDITYPDDLAENVMYLKKLINGELSYYNAEKRFVKKSGEIIWVNLSVSVVRDSEGLPVNFVSQMIDVTDRRLYEKRLKEIAASKEVLLKEVNHRVKNNLASIISMLHKEEEKAENLNPGEYKDSLNDLISRINGLATVHTLLSASEWKPLRLKNLIEELFLVYQHTIVQGKNIILGLNETDILISSNHAHNITLVINELLTNSSRHAFAGRNYGRIDIEISEKSNKIILEYKDDGPGFPDSILNGYEGINIGFELILGIVQHSLNGSVRIKNDGGALTVLEIEKDYDFEE